MFVTLKPLNERGINADQIIGRLRGKLAQFPGVTLYLQPVQDLRVGGRSATPSISTRSRATTFRICSIGRRACCKNSEPCPDYST